MRIFSSSLRLMYNTSSNSFLPKVPLLHLSLYKNLRGSPTTFGNLFARTMAGHNKWSNIRHIKEKNDALKARAFNQCALQIRKAVLSYGPDPKLNLKLAAAIQNARKVNMPNTTIESVIKKASDVKLKMGEIEVVGPGGCLLLLEVESDNINRTVHTVKTLLKKNGLGLIAKDKRGKMIFETKGVVRVSGKKDGSKLDHEKALEDAILADAEEVEESIDMDGNDILMFVSGQQDFGKMKKWFDESDYVVQDCGLEYIPVRPVELPDAELELASQLCSELEDISDIVKVNINIR